LVTERGRAHGRGPDSGEREKEILLSKKCRMRAKWGGEKTKKRALGGGV